MLSRGAVRSDGVSLLLKGVGSDRSCLGDDNVGSTYAPRQGSIGGRGLPNLLLGSWTELGNDQLHFGGPREVLYHKFFHVDEIILVSRTGHPSMSANTKGCS